MSRLRLSAYILCIKTGRWTKPNSIPVNERNCLTCDVIEDEYHFVLECSMYKDLRMFIFQSIIEVDLTAKICRANYK